MPTKSWKNHPQKLLRKTQIHFFPLLPGLPGLPKRSKQKNSYSKMWLKEQLYIELGLQSNKNCVQNGKKGLLWDELVGKHTLNVSILDFWELMFCQISCEVNCISSTPVSVNEGDPFGNWDSPSIFFPFRMVFVSKFFRGHPLRSKLWPLRSKFIKKNLEEIQNVTAIELKQVKTS